MQAEIYQEFGFFVLALCIKQVLNFECIAKLNLVETAKLLILSTKRDPKQLPTVAEIRQFNLFGPYSSKDDLFIKIVLDNHTQRAVFKDEKLKVWQTQHSFYAGMQSKDY